MADMLVNLLKLRDNRTIITKLAEEDIIIKRAITPEKYLVTEWVRKNLGDGWASECEVAFARLPVACHIALSGKEILGFACYEATYKNFFGPTGVLEQCRGKGVGTALLLASLQSMADMGYAYAIIGGVGPVEYYNRTVGAVLIEGSHPGVYGNIILP